METEESILDYKENMGRVYDISMDDLHWLNERNVKSSREIAEFLTRYGLSPNVKMINVRVKTDTGFENFKINTLPGKDFGSIMVE